MNKDTWNMIERLKSSGISEADALALRRISMTLHRWHEMECGDGNDYASWCIERDEQTDKPYLVTYPHTGSKSSRRRIPDRETGAIARLEAIMQHYPDRIGYVQGDPRGASLYIVSKADIPPGADIDSCYSRGIAIYK